MNNNFPKTPVGIVFQIHQQLRKIPNVASMNAATPHGKYENGVPENVEVL